MRKKIIYTVLLFCIQGYLSSQSFQWVKQIGGTSPDNSQAIGTDASGNIYTAGFFQGTADFDPGPGSFNLTSAGSDDIFISKLDALGNFLWAKRIGSTLTDGAQYLTVDPSGNVIITGYFQGSVDFDPGTASFLMTAFGGLDAFACKLDASGNFVWAKQISGSSGEQGLCVTTNTLGEIFVTGIYAGVVDFDPGPANLFVPSSGFNDAFIVKLDASGNFMWTKKFGGTNEDYANSVIINASGNVIITGRFSGTCDFDPSASTFNMVSAGSTDMYVCELDGAGNFIWAKRVGGTNNDVGYSINLDATGNIYVNGWFFGTVDFDPGAPVFNLVGTNFEAFILKLDPVGNFIWAKQMGGSLNDAGQSIILDASGNIYTTGYFQGTADFDPSPSTQFLTSFGVEDIFISKLDPSGNLIWVKKLGGVGADIGSSIVMDAAGDLLVTGIFNSTADFDPGSATYSVVSFGASDAFVFKISSCGGTPSDPGAISGSVSLCSGATSVYSVAPITGATSYTWIIPGTWSGSSLTNTISITTDPSSGTISVAAGNVCGNSSAQTLAITVNTVSPATPGTISGNTLICAGTSNNFSVSPINEATSYIWSFPSGWSNTSQTNTIASISNVNSGTISVFALNGCGSSSMSTMTVVVATIPNPPSVINGSTLVCQGSTTIFSVNPMAGVSYSWSFPATWTVSGTSNTINPVVGTSGGTISVSSQNMCGNSASQTLSVTVIDIPLTPGSIAGNTFICVGTANNYSISTVPLATTYFWSLPGVWSGSSVTNTITTTAGLSGNISVIAGNSCGNSGAQILAVTVNSVPLTPSSISGNMVVCNGASNIFSTAAVSGATTYAWFLPPGWSGSSSTNSITTNAGSNSGTISVIAGNMCGNSPAQFLAVNTLTTPSAPIVITGDTVVCSASPAVYSVSPVVGASVYYWVLPNGFTGSSNTNTMTSIAGMSGGSISVIAGNSCFNSLAQNLNVTVTPSPTLSASSSHSILCNSDQTAILTATGASNYTWNPSGAGGTSLAVSPTVTTIYFITGANTNGCIDTLSFTQAVGICEGLIDNRVVLDGVNVYPNPFSTKIKVTVPSGVKGRMTIHNAIGTLIEESNIAETEKEVNLENYSDGIYLITIKESENNFRTFRVIKL